MSWTEIKSTDGDLGRKRERETHGREKLDRNLDSASRIGSLARYGEGD